MTDVLVDTHAFVWYLIQPELLSKKAVQALDQSLRTKGWFCLSVPDMPDRIIAATALSLNIPLITKDHRIQKTKVKTIW